MGLLMTDDINRFLKPEALDVVALNFNWLRFIPILKRLKNMTELERVRREYLVKLQRLAEETLGGAVYEMYREGTWSGILNHLDSNSPIAAQTIEHAEEWFRYGQTYLQRYVERMAA